jgi:hypothetical protein
MSFEFKFTGELINEDKIIPGGKESAGMSVEGDDPKEDGIATRLFAEEAGTARGWCELNAASTNGDLISQAISWLLLCPSGVEPLARG